MTSGRAGSGNNRMESEDNRLQGERDSPAKIVDGENDVGGSGDNVDFPRRSKLYKNRFLLQI